MSKPTQRSLRVMKRLNRCAYCIGTRIQTEQEMLEVTTPSQAEPIMYGRCWANKSSHSCVVKRRSRALLFSNGLTGRSGHEISAEIYWSVQLSVSWKEKVLDDCDTSVPTYSGSKGNS